MAPNKPYTVKLDLDLLAALKSIKERDGITESEQIRRALKDWFKKHGVGTPAHKAAWDDWTDRFRHAKDKASVRVPAEVCRSLEGRPVGDLSTEEEASLAHTAALLGREPDLNILRATMAVRRAVKRGRGR